MSKWLAGSPIVALTTACAAPRALARHGDELTAAPDPDVVAELDRSVQEWSRIRLADELEHLWNIMCT